jgi:hypothetical protein
LKESSVLATVKKPIITRLKMSTSNVPEDKSKPHRSFHLGKKGKVGIGVALIAIILVSAFIFFPRTEQTIGTPGNSTEPVATTNATTPPSTRPSYTNAPTTVPVNPWQPIVDAFTGKDRSTQVVTNSQVVNNSVWRQVAAYSWNYFQPGVGVDSRTGLPASGDTVGFFTDWDVGVYIQAVMDAQKIGLIGTDGPWGSSARIDKVMTFLENRELNSTSHFPYWFYQNDGTVDHNLSDKATEVCYTADIGRLFVALNNLKAFNSSYSSRIDNFVYNTNGNRSNYAVLVPSLKAESLTSTSIYSYYIITGFASFWPAQLKDAPAKILNNIMSAPTVRTPENVTLPNSRLTEEPLLCALFEISNNPAQLKTLSAQAYLAHEAYYNATNHYRAFSEGNTFTDAWAYEWIVYDGKTWQVRDGNSELNINPIIYTKVAFSFLAIYNTTFARNMVMYIEDKMENPSNGYSNGVDEIGTLLGATGLHTNGLILSAARYAIQNSS